MKTLLQLIVQCGKDKQDNFSLQNLQTQGYRKNNPLYGGRILVKGMEANLSEAACTYTFEKKDTH